MINVAILGAGIGQQHLEAYRSLPDRFTVSVMCDLDEAKARAATDNDASVRIASNVDDVLNDSAIDLIDICLPPQLHASFAIRALESGKDVVCEKPIARSLSELETIKKALQQSGRQLFPVFQYRYGLAMEQLRALIAEGLAGNALVASAETHWNREEDYYAVPWRGTWDSESGGAVLSHAIHSHDILCDVLGPVSALNAFTDTRVNDIEVEDCAAISMRMQSGALATSSITLGAATNTSRFRFCFQGLTAESGTLPYTPAEDVWTFTARGSTHQEDIDRILAATNTPRSGFCGFLEATADALEGNGGNAVSFADGQRSIEFVTAVYASARQAGMSVTLPLGEQHELYDGWLPSMK